MKAQLLTVLLAWPLCLRFGQHELARLSASNNKKEEETSKANKSWPTVCTKDELQILYIVAEIQIPKQTHLQPQIQIELHIRDTQRRVLRALNLLNWKVKLQLVFRIYLFEFISTNLRLRVFNAYTARDLSNHNYGYFFKGYYL